MKNNLKTLSLLVLLASPAISFADVSMPSVADASRVNAIASYRLVGSYTSNLPTSQVVEVSLDGVQSTGVAVVNAQGTPVGSYMGTRTTLETPKSQPTVRVRGFTTSTSTSVYDIGGDDARYINIPELGDQVQLTTYRFSPRFSGKMERAILKVDLSENREVGGMVITSPPASTRPRNIEIYINNGLSKSLIYAGAASPHMSIPATQGSSFDVVVDYDSPVVFSDLSVQAVSAQSHLTYEPYVRFLAEPGMTYYVLTALGAGYQQLVSPSGYQYSSGSASRVGISFSENPWFTSVDTDRDGTPDSKDNCPRIMNIDQKDLDHNNIGDVCEDPDRDNIPNSLDNCPNVYNPDQKDTDNDKTGDVCDSVDDRIGQQEPWLKWVSFIAVALTIGAMVYSVKKDDGLSQA